VEMAKILECGVEECAYNMDHDCHAMAITVGGTIDHKCDTFCQSSLKGGVADISGTVGACKVSTCAYNMNLECAAPGIKVGHVGEEVDCLTFTMD